MQTILFALGFGLILWGIIAALRNVPRKAASKAQVRTLWWKMGVLLFLAFLSFGLGMIAETAPPISASEWITSALLVGICSASIVSFMFGLSYYAYRKTWLDVSEHKKKENWG